MTCRTNPKIIHDFSDFVLLPRQPNVPNLKKRYNETNLSSRQLAQEFGISRTLVTDTLKDAGVKISRGRGGSAENYTHPNSPYGFQVRAGKLVISNNEMRIARMVIEYRDRRCATWMRVADALNTKGFRTRTGALWTQWTVRPVHKHWSGKI